MVETDGGRLVSIVLDSSDLRAIDDGETLEVECPHTGETIYITVGSLGGYECECCGQRVERPDDAITPSARGLTERLLDGGTAVYDSVHNEEDITIVFRADHEACGGWK